MPTNASLGSAFNCAIVTLTTSALAAKGIKVYPNPANDKINIRLGANQLNVESIELADVVDRVAGKVGKQTTLSIPSDKPKPGVYMVRFKGTKTKTQRVVIK